jgi:hypothetical protein
VVVLLAVAVFARGREEQIQKKAGTRFPVEFERSGEPPMAVETLASPDHREVGRGDFLRVLESVVESRVRQR